MERIGDRLIWYYWPFTDIPMPLGGLNVLTIFNTILCMVILFAMLWLGARRLTRVPGRGQMLVELFVTGLDSLVSASLELETRRENRKFLPLIASLFAFLLLANFIGFLPHPIFEAPTADINCTLGLGIMGMTIATYCGVRVKGMKGYIEELLGPLWSTPDASGGALIAGKASALFFFPMNVIGELAKVVSISFRIFGNILGGAIIVVVVSSLTWQFVFPIGLNFFFTFFIGVIQAFVFTMLTLTYIAVAIK